MTMNKHESISALLDGELSAQDLATSVDDFKHPDICCKLQRFSLIGETLRNGESGVADDQFYQRLKVQLENEETFSNVVLESSGQVLENVPAAANDSLWKRMGGYAVVASVAIVAFAGIQQYGQNNDTNRVVAQQTTASPQIELAQASIQTSELKPRKETTDSATRFQTADPQTRDLLKFYVDQHIKHANTPSFVPAVRVISYADFK